MMNKKIYKNPDELIKAFIKKDQYIHISTTLARPNALVNALVRNFYDKNPNFTISITGLHSNANAIALTKIAKKVITGFAGENYPRPSSHPLYENLLNGNPFELELWSLLSLEQRFFAGAMRLPGFITNSLLNSDLLADKLGKSAFLISEKLNEHNQKLLILTPLNPDITMIHGVIADEDGNIVLTPPYGEGIYPALASKMGVIASVEKIVSRDSIPPEYVSLSGINVLGICEAKFGAHPQALRVNQNLKIVGTEEIKTYYDDYDYIHTTNLETAKLETSNEWLHKWILNCDHDKYLELLGNDRFDKLTLSPIYIQNKLEKKKNVATAEFNESEQLIILAAREIIHLVKTNGYETILAGIGTAHISAWLAYCILKEEGIAIKILAELGFYGVNPYQGDVFLFSQLHADHSEQLSDIFQILGNLVPKKCLGVLGAAELDITGNINSTSLKDGKFIVGTGGANDIASTADCVVVARASKNRFVKKVHYITAPGLRVISLATQFGVFRKNENLLFTLKTFINPNSELNLSPNEILNKYTGWDIISNNLDIEKSISQKELEILRKIDTEKLYI